MSEPCQSSAEEQSDLTQLEQEERQYKRSLENWREVIVHMNSLLLWKKPYYPGIIVGYISFLFIILWYFEPSLLTTISVFGIIACALDFAVPALSNSVFDSSKWTSVQEREFEDICQNLIHYKYKMNNFWLCLCRFKEARPKLHFIMVVGGLIFIAWISNLINNLLLVYFVVMLATLYPGIKSRGILEQHFIYAIKLFKKIINEKPKET